MKFLPFLNRFNFALAMLVALAAVLGFWLIPFDKVLPVHWGLSGTPDAFAPAPVAIGLPMLIVAIVLLLLALLRPAGLQRDFEAGRHIIDVAVGTDGRIYILDMVRNNVRIFEKK